MLTLVALLLEATLLLGIPAPTTPDKTKASTQAATTNDGAPVAQFIGSGGWHDED